MSRRFVHDDRFVESFANADHVVYGRKLDPLCLWHQLCLEVAQSKILLGESLTPVDLWIAVKICTTPWTPQFRVPDLDPPGKLMFILKFGRYDFAVEMQKFQKYLEDYMAAPKLWPNQHKQETEDVATRDFDETLETALHIVSSARFTWPEVWTMPIGAARWCHVGLSKLKGAKIDIWTPEHEEMFVEHKRKREAGIDARGKEIALEKNIPYADARKIAHDEHWAKANINLHGFARS